MAESSKPEPPALVNYALLVAKRLRAQPRHVVMQKGARVAALVILEAGAVDKVIEELERLAGKPKPVAKKTRREPR